MIVFDARWLVPFLCSVPSVLAAATPQGTRFPAPQTGGKLFAILSASADFDGDGFSDVAQLSSQNDLWIHRGDGNGAFDRPARIDLTFAGYDLLVDDFDADGDPDVLIVAQSNFHVLPNLGAAGFGAPIDSPSPAFAGVLASADVDHDGHVDLLGGFGSGVRVFPGLGGGTFGAPIASTTGVVASELEPADANHDGKLDVWILDAGISGSQRVALALGNGDGTFQAASSLPLSDYAMAIRAGDFDGDGFVDAAVARRDVSTAPGSVLVFLARPDGSFVAGGEFACGPEPFDLAAADLDGDGALDLGLSLWGAHYDPELEVLRGDGHGAFASFSRTLGGTHSRRLEFGRLDADDALDALLAGDIDEPVTALRGLGDGHFEGTSLLAVGAPAVRSIAADVVGSTAVDLVATVPSTKQLAYVENLGGGHFASARFVDVLGLPFAVRAADLDHDGHGDLVALVTVGSTPRLATLLSDGVGGFHAPQLGAAMRWSAELQLADVDGDGELDALAPHRERFSVQVGLGGGTFAPPSMHALLGGAYSLGIGDLNADGWLDVISLDDRNAKVAVVLGRGAAQFGVPQLFASIPKPMALALADFDVDGRVDLAILGAAPQSQLAVLLGDGAGSFDERMVLSAGYARMCLVAADITGDGVADLATGGEPGGNVRLHANQGGAHFAAPTAYALAAHPSTVGAADFDADGKLDIFGSGGLMHGVVVSFQR